MTTAKKTKVAFYFAGEHTTNYSPQLGLLPERNCGHKHKSRETAEKCAAKHYPWKAYAELEDGRTTTTCEAILYHS